MDYLQQLQTFVRGDIQQGKWMIGIAFFVFLPITFFLLKNNLPLQKGMVVPVFLLFIINVGYGGYVLYAKPKLLAQTEQQFQSHSQQMLAAELEKSEKDHNNYTTLKYVWGICMIVFTILFFILSKDYYKGLSIGFVAMFFAFLIIDSLFHQRLTIYRDALKIFMD